MTPQEPTGTPAEPTQNVDTSQQTPAEATPAPATPEGPSLTFEVDGEQVTVSQADAAQHFLRQQDYTKKTQALAEQRDALSEADALRAALEANPAETVAVLQEAYGLTAAEAAAVSGQEPQVAWEDLDPEQQRIARLEEQVASHENAQLQQQVEREFAQIEAQVGGQIDRNAVLAHAIRNEIPNLAIAYRDMTYYQQQAATQATEQRTAQDAAARERAAADNFVEGGHSPATGAVQPGANAPVDGIRAAFALAKRQHGQ